jgi:hypothetical protein
MKGKKLMFALVIATLMALPLSAFAAEPGDPDTAVQVTDASFRCGETGTSQILVSIANDPGDPKPMHGVEVHLSFDPTKLQVVDADGDPGNGVQITAEAGLFPLEEQAAVQSVDNAAGTILFAVSRKDATSVQDATDAAIATITWEAAVDCATVTQEDCSEVSVASALMSDADGYAITVDTLLSGNVCYDGGEELGCIMGSVELQGRYDHSGAQILVTEADGTPVAEAFTDANGIFELYDLPVGTYEVWAKMYGYLDAVKGSGVQIVPGECMDMGATKLLGGDVAPQDPEPDDIFDIGDITYMGANFGAAEATADVNGDGVVNILDLTMAAANFGRAGPTPWSMTP